MQSASIPYYSCGEAVFSWLLICDLFSSHRGLYTRLYTHVCMWVLVCSCSASGYCQLSASCNSFHVACCWLKQSISIGLQLPHLIFKEQWQYEQSHLIFILCCKVWAFRGGSSLAWFRAWLCLGTNVCMSACTCMSVCLYMRVYAFAKQQAKYAINRTFSSLVQCGGCV